MMAEFVLILWRWALLFLAAGILVAAMRIERLLQGIQFVLNGGCL